MKLKKKKKKQHHFYYCSWWIDFSENGINENWFLFELKAVLHCWLLHSMNEFRRGCFSINIVIASVFLCSIPPVQTRSQFVNVCDWASMSVVRAGVVGHQRRETFNQHSSRALLKGSAARFFWSLASLKHVFRVHSKNYYGNLNLKLFFRFYGFQLKANMVANL